MGGIKKLCAIVYLVASSLLLGTLLASQVGPYTARIAELRSHDSFRWFIAACLAICALQMLYVLARVIFDRPEPDCVHPGGSPDIEVTASALESAATIAARDDDALIEDVRCRVHGRDGSSIRIEIDSIALTEHGLDELAARMQRRVESALADLLGPVAATVRVRFLPSKTTTVTREVSDE